MIPRRAVLAATFLPLAAVSACTPSEEEFEVWNVAGQQRHWTACVDGYQGMHVRLTVTATDDTVTLRAYAPPDPDQGKDQAPVGTLVQSRFSLAEPLGSRRFVRADGSPIDPLP